MASVTSLGQHEPAGLRFAIAENILPPNPPPELYQWDLFADENGEDELLTTDSCVIWSRGGDVGRCLRFDMEKEPIAKALLAYFPGETEDAGTEKNEPSRKARNNSKKKRKLSDKSLVVFLRTQAHVYSFASGDHIVHMPFEVETAIPAPRGVIIQRKSKVDTSAPVSLKFPRAPPNSFVASQTLPLTRPLSLSASANRPAAPPRPTFTLDNMWDRPLEPIDPGWPRLICLTDPMLEFGLVVAQQPERPAQERRSAAGAGMATAQGLERFRNPLPRPDVLPPAEEIIHIESIKHLASDGDDSDSHAGDNDDDGDGGELVLAVTLNRDTNMYSVWRLTYVGGHDQLTAHRRKPKTKPQRRRSSIHPAAAGGPTTASFRESLGGGGIGGGGTLAVKKTRSNNNNSNSITNNKAERTGAGADGEAAAAALEKALALEPDRAAEASRRQSRRVSSMLARADLSASHERPVFGEGGAAVPGTNLGGVAGTGVGGGASRRLDSYGSQHGRLSTGGYAGGIGGGTAMGKAGDHQHHLLGVPGGAPSGGGGGVGGSGSFLEAPVDGLLEELRSGGDFEGFHNMGLDDPELDGLSQEMLLTKIRSVSMDATTMRYSLSQHTPASQLCKVFIVVGTPYSVDEQDRNYLLVCIQDTVEKRLQLLTLHVQSRSRTASSAFGGGSKTGRARRKTLSVTWGQPRKANNVADSCKIYDGGQAMIFILSEGDGGQRQLSIQSPWSELTTIHLPPLSLHNREAYAMEGEDKSIFQSHSAGTSNCRIMAATAPSAIRFPRDKGVVDVLDEAGNHHQIQIQLEPRTARVRQILDVLRSVLPASHAEKMVVGWWHIMQWLSRTREGVSSADEWTGLVTELCVLFLSLRRPAESDSAATIPNTQSFREQPSSGTTTSQLPGNLARSWALSKAWSWALESAEVVAEAGDGPNDSIDSDKSNGGSLDYAIGLAKAYMATPEGQAAIGPMGYLPTAPGLAEPTRNGAAWGIAMALHLLLEEQKLDILAAESNGAAMGGLKMVAWQIFRWIGWADFAAAYEVDLPERMRRDAQIDEVLAALPQPANVPNIYDWIRLRLLGQTADLFPSLGDVYALVAQQTFRGDPGRGSQQKRWKSITPRTLMFRAFFQATRPQDSSVKVVEAMHRCGFTPAVLDSLPEGVVTPLQDAISRCQQHPPAHWSRDLYELVGRGDINTVLESGAGIGGGGIHGGGGGGLSRGRSGASTGAESYQTRHVDDIRDEINHQALEEPESEERQAVIAALFRDDKRLVEAQNLLSAAKPRVVRLDPQPDWTESQYLEQQKELVNTLATGTLATPSGRAMLHYGFRFPLLTQKFHVQGFNLTCIVKPTNVAVGVDKALFTEDKVNWAFFHQGVAYGLTISAKARGIDTSWIVFNKPPGADLSHRHAGFLLALGLNGHLKSVAKWVAFKYLTPKHMMTSIGLLLGLAVSHLGTMDSLITRLLSVHVTRMLPRGAAELNLSHQIQTTGIMGIGLVYYRSQHRRMSEIMLSEIAYLDDEDDESPLRNEGYRLAAGFALGFINLGKGASDRKGLLDMQITEQLLSLATATKKVELVNVLDRSAAAATVAIALMFLRTEDHMVARKVDIPDSILQFDYVRPDILLLRTLAKNLILWSQIEATFDWVRASLPPEYRGEREGDKKGKASNSSSTTSASSPSPSSPSSPSFLLDDVVALRSQDLPRFAIIAGLCFAAALRFAGSANTRVRDLLVHYLDRFIHIVQDLPADTFDAQAARSGARMCLDNLALSCATVMAGTGDLVVLRRLRALHGRDDVHTTYGSHLAAHLAIGALFLGSGTTTFGNSNLAVAALLVAFYPLFPTSIQDNASHLQAFRHFWVLATESRCLVAKDVATGQPISVPVVISLKEAAVSVSISPSGASSSSPSVILRQTPCLLPPLDDILSVRTDAAAHGFWDLEIPFERQPALRAAFQANQNLYLRRRPAHESAFSTTLQALRGNGADAIGSRSDSTKRSSTAVTASPLEWVLHLDRFKSLSRAERAYMLGQGGPGEGGRGGANDSSGVSGSGGSFSNAIDSRLVLEGALDRWSRDSLLDLRLVLDWADHREELRRSDGGDQHSKKASDSAAKERGDDKMDLSNDDDDIGIANATSKEKADWWLPDTAVDLLKGRVWLDSRGEAEGMGEERL